jgi:phosphocarrier protein HPr
MPEREAKIVNKLGIHARPAAEIVKTAGKFKSNIIIVRDDLEVNAKSIMGVMMLAAGKGTKVTLETSGPDETEAMEAIVALINDCFGEGQ